MIIQSLVSPENIHGDNFADFMFSGCISTVYTAWSYHKGGYLVYKCNGLGTRKTSDILDYIKRKINCSK